MNALIKTRWFRVLAALLGVLAIAYSLAAIGARKAGELPFFADLPDRPLVIAHQGGEHLRPSNTMESFAHAMALGVDVLEMDIHSTRDGVLVTIHDDTVDRTTDGTGRVNELSLAEIRELDAGYYWTDDAGRYPYRGQGIEIATLETVFTAFPDVPMNIEIKQVSPSIAQPFCELIRQHEKANDVLVASFHEQAMSEFRAACPEVATSMVTNEVAKLYAQHFLFSARAFTPMASAVQVPEERFGIQILTPNFVSAAQSRNLDVHVWTVNDSAEMQHFLDLGVDGIITDRPDLLLALLNK